ncbi:carbamoyl phosphate synthase small subunit, partial [Nocardia farcinica]|nr:carbamoyl phosphate synthase small subunit [Nocardia farcinica]
MVNALITTSLPEDVAAVAAELAAYRVSGAVEATSCTQPYTLPALGEQRYSVGLLDYGLKSSIADSLRQRGCQVTVYPALTPAEELLAA